MGLIAPEQASKKKNISSKRIISDSLRRQLLEEIAVPTADGDSVIMTRAQALGQRLLDIALFSKSDKTSATAAKIILESTEGKPAVQTDDVNTEIPSVKFILQSDDQKKLEQKALNAPGEDEIQSVFKVDMGNGEGCEIPVEEDNRD